MPARAIETERKFMLEPDAPMPDLAGVDGIAAVERIGDTKLDAVYYDTADLRLARDGITLRRREGGKDAGWHLKLPAPHSSAREEITCPLGKTSDAAPPDDLRSLVTAYARTAALAPVARLRTERATWQLLDASGSVLAEVTDDRVEVDPDPGAPATRFREIEVESRNGDAHLLAAVAGTLAAAGAVEDAFTPKLVRALASRAQRPPDVPVPPDTLARDAPATEAVAADIRRHTRSILQSEPQVRLGTPDAVHKMRVAVRRLRSSLRTFRPLLNRDLTAPVERDLKWLGHVLGEARDAEVTRDRLVREMDDVAPEDARRQPGKRVRSVLDARYDDAHTTLLATMDEPRYRNLLEVVVALAATPPVTDRASRAVDDLVPSLVRKAWRRARRRAKRAIDKGADASLHDARKAAKNARYAAEAVVPVYGTEAAAFGARMEAIQEVLGAHQDAVVARGLILSLPAGRRHRRRHAALRKAVVAAEERTASESQAEFKKVWKQASKPKHRRWLRA